MRITIPRSIRCFDPRRFLFTLGVLALAVFLLGLRPQPALAQFSSPGGGVDDSNGVFQLEGNATTDTGICFQVSPPIIATPGGGNSCPAGLTFVAFGSQTDDWANVFTGVSLHAVATTGIVGDATNSSSDDIFTGGGAKDTLGLQSGPWLWKNGKPQAKDDIAHAYAAAYTLPNGHTGIYFGIDRFDNSGDATAGFWFFQDSTVGLGGANKGGGTRFTGQHFDGDLLIVSDFSTGGAVSTIEVFKWVGSDANGSLVLAETLTSNATCNPITGNSSACSIVNPIPVATGGWGFTNKSGQTFFDHGEFLEGGLDLQSIFGANVPCFTTFMAETRSSTSPTATLSDFSPPVSFPLCGLHVTKACNGPGVISADGSSVAYSWTATAFNDGIGSLSNVSLNDTLPDGSKVSIPVTSLLGPKPASASVQVNFTATSSNVPNPLSVTNSTNAQGFTGPNGTGNLIASKPPDATAVCSATVGETLTIEKHCDASKGGATLVDTDDSVVVEVFYTAHVCNAGTPGSGSQLTNITLADDHGSPLTHDIPSPSSIPSLNPGQCADVTGSYFPNSIDSSLGRFGFTDTIRVTGATATLGPNPTPVSGCPSNTDLACAPVTCPICFDNVCTGQPQP